MDFTTHTTGRQILARKFKHLLNILALRFSIRLNDKLENIIILINRPDTLLFFDEIIHTAGFIGLGLLTIHSISGSVEVFHNAYYGIHVSLVLLGLTSFLLLIFKKTKGLLQALKNKKSEIVCAVLVSLIITLLVEGSKYPSGVSRKWFLFIGLFLL